MSKYYAGWEARRSLFRRAETPYSAIGAPAPFEFIVLTKHLNSQREFITVPCRGIVEGDSKAAVLAQIHDVFPLAIETFIHEVTPAFSEAYLEFLEVDGAKQCERGAAFPCRLFE
jgi:hypothetical protein